MVKDSGWICRAKNPQLGCNDWCNWLPHQTYPQGLKSPGSAAIGFEVSGICQFVVAGKDSHIAGRTSARRLLKDVGCPTAVLNPGWQR